MTDETKYKQELEEAERLATSLNLIGKMEASFERQIKSSRALVENLRNSVLDEDRDTPKIRLMRHLLQALDVVATVKEVEPGSEPPRTGLPIRARCDAESTKVDTGDCPVDYGKCSSTNGVYRCHHYLGRFVDQDSSATYALCAKIRPGELTNTKRGKDAVIVNGD